MIVLAEKKIEYTSKQISFSEKGHKGPDVMALNPRGQVPTFKDGDVVVCESTAICLYLESTYKNQGLILMPKDSKQRSKVLQKGFEADENIMDKQKQLIMYFRMTKEEDRKEEKIKELQDKLKDELNIWEKYLGECGTEFLGGAEFTMADVFFFPFVAWQWRMSLDLGKFPYLKAYFERVKERPSIKATWPPHWNEGDAQPANWAFMKNI